VVAVGVVFMVVTKLVLATVAVMMWWCKVGVIGNSCCSGGCSAADLFYKVEVFAAVSIHIII
jgi:hypothetical protein